MLEYFHNGDNFLVSDRNLPSFHLSPLRLVLSPGPTVVAQLCVLALSWAWAGCCQVLSKSSHPQAERGPVPQHLLIEQVLQTQPAWGPSAELIPVFQSCHGGGGGLKTECSI